MFEFSSIDKYQTQLREGKLTCLQTVKHFLEKIRGNEHLNAFIEVYEEEALQKAVYLDNKRKSNVPLGELHGVIVGLKDIICYANHKISAASNILKARPEDPVGQDFISIYSATVVERLLQEDAIIIGNLNCDEFAMGSTNENSAYGRVLNSLGENRVPGGSSGGSAVAVQAGLCMVSLGSDTGGSVRQPADFCGIIGLKPTYGRISRYGLIAYASSFDQIGIFGNNIVDVAKILEIISGPDEFDSTVLHLTPEGYSSQINSITERKYRFAYFPEALDHPSLDPEIAEGIKNLITKLVAEGHSVEPVQFEYLDYIVPTYYVLTTAEASSNLSRYDGVKFGFRAGAINDLTDLYRATRSEGFGKEVKRRIMLGTFVLSTGYYDAYFTKAQQVRKLLADTIQLVFNEFDFIVLPTVPSTAFKIGEKVNDPIAMYLADIYTVLANLVGIPAISLPLFRHSNGMPFGLQIMANRSNDLSLLLISHQIFQQYNVERKPRDPIQA